MDFVGPRLTGSPNMKRANEWTRDKLTAFGLTNAHLESWGPFGRGWSYEECTVRMTAPDVAQLWALPRAWTPGTNGVITGKPVRVKIETVEDIEKYRGKLAGKIVLNGDAREIKPHEQSQFYALQREAARATSRTTSCPASRASRARRSSSATRFRKALTKFLAEEKPLVMIDSDSADFGNFHVQGAGTQRDGESYPVPSIVMSTEHYNRLARLVDRRRTSTLEVNVKTKYYDDDQNAYNTIAEIPGTDKKGEVVMLGGHLDSWHGGTGATDNGAGAVGGDGGRAHPQSASASRRSAPSASRSGAAKRKGCSARAPTSPSTSRRARADRSAAERDLPAADAHGNAGPLTIKPEHAKLSAYFNLDNGTGKIRGIYAQGNEAVRADLRSVARAAQGPRRHDRHRCATPAAPTTSPSTASACPASSSSRTRSSTSTRTHHTNYDVYDRLQRDDLMQAAVVMATFVWEAANRPEMMPRKPLAKSDLPARGGGAASGAASRPQRRT